ncbi:hypothetical protein V6N11_016521 [Hibiscus sabdariffa]|uniref:Uncharacterized protein n=1 Tax=Hibiscus sabdariffa TaxID=183260 RepID=A0ABR2TVZ2_9ROSI
MSWGVLFFVYAISPLIETANVGTALKANARGLSGVGLCNKGFFIHNGFVISSQTWFAGISTVMKDPTLHPIHLSGLVVYVELGRVHWLLENWGKLNFYMVYPWISSPLILILERLAVKLFCLYRAFTIMSNSYVQMEILMKLRHSDRNKQLGFLMYGEQVNGKARSITSGYSGL